MSLTICFFWGTGITSSSHGRHLTVKLAWPGSELQAGRVLLTPLENILMLFGNETVRVSPVCRTECIKFLFNNLLRGVHIQSAVTTHNRVCHA